MVAPGSAGADLPTHLPSLPAWRALPCVRHLPRRPPAGQRPADDADLKAGPARILRPFSSHWQAPRGVNSAQQGYADWHNAGVDAAQRGRVPPGGAVVSAPRSEAPTRKRRSAWVARASARSEQGNHGGSRHERLHRRAALYDQAGPARKTSAQLQQAGTLKLS